MTNKRPPLLKRQLMVDQNIQLPLLTYSLFMATMGVATASIFSMVWAQNFVNLGDSWKNPVLLIFGGVFSYTVMVVLGLYITNRVAGPLHRMKLHMRDVVDGKNPAPLTKRKDDYIASELIEDYNKLVQMLQKR